MIEGSTCDDLSFSAPKLVTPEGHALPSHRQRVGENRRARRCVLAIDAVAKMRRKRAAYAPIRAHYHGMITVFWGSTRRARPRRAPGNSARRARAAADAGIASRSRATRVRVDSPRRPVREYGPRRSVDGRGSRVFLCGESLPPPGGSDPSKEREDPAALSRVIAKFDHFCLQQVHSKYASGKQASQPGFDPAGSKPARDA
jgi:hypothetical protein